MKDSKKVYIRTFGCQMNVADSEWMRGILAGRGWQIAENEEDADVVLLNTCSVRGLAEQKVWSKLGELKKSREQNAKRKVKGPLIGVTGCMAQNYGGRIFDRAPYVNLVCGTYRFNRIDELLDKVQDGMSHVLEVEREYKDFNTEFRHLKKSQITSFVPISRGCNNRCSYCIVPYVRGPEDNRPLKEILAEVIELADSGYKEITFLGQNVNSYKDNGNDFVYLLEQANEIKGIERIRFVTNHPKDAGIGLFKAIRELDKVCEYLHLPVQSGSNSILKKMNRGYTREHYLELMTKTRQIAPNIAVSTDIIAGFSGETERDFQDTYNLMKEIEFDSAFIFKYSPRAGTPAEVFGDDVSLDVKMERNNCLLKLQDDISMKKNEKLISSVLEVLVENVSKNNKPSPFFQQSDTSLQKGLGKSRLMGRTRTNKIAVFPGEGTLIGQLADIKIMDANAHTLFGELV